MSKIISSLLEYFTANEEHPRALAQIHKANEQNKRQKERFSYTKSRPRGRLIYCITDLIIPQQKCLHYPQQSRMSVLLERQKSLQSHLKV